jgi:hypothetical protein
MHARRRRRMIARWRVVFKRAGSVGSRPSLALLRCAARGAVPSGSPEVLRSRVAARSGVSIWTGSRRWPCGFSASVSGSSVPRVRSRVSARVAGCTRCSTRATRTAGRWRSVSASDGAVGANKNAIHHFAPTRFACARLLCLTATKPAPLPAIRLPLRPERRTWLAREFGGCHSPIFWSASRSSVRRHQGRRCPSTAHTAGTDGSC